jgi:integrase
MTGCLQIKNGMYYIVLSTYENGKRKRPWIATGLPAKGNKRKAEQMLREKLHECELQSGIIRSDVLFSDYVRHWLTIARRRVDEVTYQGYLCLANTHVLPYFDALGIKLQDVTLPVLQAYIDEKQTRGRKDEKGGLSARSLRMHKNILHQTLDEAVKANLLPSNPSQYLVLPKQERHEARFYNAQQLQALFDAIRDEPIYPMVKITALYGLRRSELLGLKWDSIDFDAGTMTIRHTVAKVTSIVEKDKTKNASSRRTFPLTEEARSIFAAAKAAQAQNRRLFGREYHASDYVFTWPDGRPYSPDYITDKFSTLLRKHDLPHIRFHELRHSCASLLLNNGFGLKDVQEWLGHSDIKMTANIYGHLDVARKQNIADRLSCSLAEKW